MGDIDSLAIAQRRELLFDITLEDVLTMRLGLEWNEWDPPCELPDNQLFRFHDNHHDYSKGLLDLPLAHSPGEQFAYNTIASTSLGQALENSALPSADPNQLYRLIREFILPTFSASP